MPPLRERKEDIVLLANYFLETYAEDRNVEKKDMSQDVIEVFENYKWPGNVRELKNIIERLMTLSGKDETIEFKHLPVEMITATQSGAFVKERKKTYKLKDTLKSLEKEAIEKELIKANWNKTVASRELGISRASLNIKIAQFNIQPKN